MKDKEMMFWTKRQTQWYGIFMALLGFLMGVSMTILIAAWFFNSN